MDHAALSARQQRASDTILENERLTRDLTDDQARVLIEWASAQASQRAADLACTDAQLETWLLLLGRAVRQVGRIAPAEHDPIRLLELAQQMLEQARHQQD